MARQTRRERCRAGRHTPTGRLGDGEGSIRRDTCRYCGAPIIRTHATRIWFAAGLMAASDPDQIFRT